MDPSVRRHSYKQWLANKMDVLCRVYDPTGRQDDDGGMPGNYKQVVANARLVPGERVLDVGCGWGRGIILAAEQVGSSGRVVGVDLSGEMLAKAREFTARFGWVSLVQGDAERPDLFPEGSFDVVMCTLVFKYFPEPLVALGNWLRWLRPGGRISFDHGLDSPATAILRRVAGHHGLRLDGEGWETRDRFRGSLAASGFVSVEVQTPSDSRAWDGKRADKRFDAYVSDEYATQKAGASLPLTPLRNEFLKEVRTAVSAGEAHEHISHIYVTARKSPA